MSTMFIEIGVFTIALVLVMLFQVYGERKQYRDCLLFSRLLLATIGILLVDTIGWVIDGNPIGGQIWITTVIDGLDLLLTTTVCWCWVQYAMYFAHGEKKIPPWYKDFPTLLLFLQMFMVATSQALGHYFSVDAEGVYHREQGYFLHSLISLIMLMYSSLSCLHAYKKEEKEEKKKELLFVTFIILVPVIGNVIQLYVYGYPTVWLCMVFMVLTVFVHTQNKRVLEERKEQNRALQDALVKAQAANKAKTDFLARMSHDMRTPMNGILGLSYLMEDQDDIEKIKKAIPELRESGKYLLQLINDVLDVNKVESGKIELHPVPCAEKDVFDSIIEMVKPQIDEKKITFHVVTKQIDWTYMKMDVPRVKQVFINLLSNAIKFTPEGGTIDFIMELVSKDEQMIRDKFVVRDTGIGMTEEFLPHAFEPFEQEHRLQEGLGGTGLGLSIVKSIVELMGGTIEVKSTKDIGTEFTLFLNFPLAAKEEIDAYRGGLTEAASSENRSEKSSEADVRDKKIKREAENGLPPGLHILMCEDHPLNAKIAMRLLEKQAVSVTWMENGKLGVEAFEKSEQGFYDVILMDIRMPVMDGLMAAQAIRALKRPDAKEVPIFAMTANAYEEDIKKSLSAGMNEHLAKPVDPKILFETIGRYVKK